MLRRFFRDSSIYAIAAAIGQGIAFVLFPFFAHTFHPRDYGAIDIIVLLGILTNLTVALEISQGLGRELNEARDEATKSVCTSSALFFALGCWSLFALLTLTLAAPLSRAVLGPGFGPGLMRLAVATWCVSGILYLIQDQLRWRLRPRAFAGVSVLVAVVTTASSATLVFGLHDGVDGAIAGQLAGAACGLAATAALSRGIYRWAFDWDQCRRMLAYSIPLIPASVGVFLNGYADRLVLQHRGSLAQVGVYGVAYRLAAIVALVLVGFQGATTPLLFARYKEPGTAGELAQMFRLFCAIGLAAFLALSMFADQLVRLLAAPAYAPAASIVPYVIGATLLGGMWMFAPGPLIARRTGTVAIVWVSAGLLNAGLALLLVPPLGIKGAAVATLVSSMWAFGGLMALSQRDYHVPHDWWRLARATALTVVIVALGALVVPSGHAAALRPDVVALRLLLVGCGIVALVGLLLDPGERASLWRLTQTRVRLGRAVGLRSR